MKLNKRDSRVLILFLLIAVSFAVLFYFDITKKIDISDREVIGTIHYKNNIVQRKLEDQVIWERLETNSPLVNKDTIRSESYSDAIIQLNDGTEINIDENSMFNLDLSGDKPSIEFAQGSLHVKKGTSADTNLVIKSQGSQIDVGSGELKLEKEAKKELSLFVESGNSKITRNGKETEIASGKKAQFDSSGSVTVKQIPVRLKSPASQKLFLTLAPSVRINFEWELDPGYTESIIEISRSPLFKLQLLKELVVGRSFSTSLKEGTYYWRVQTKDPKTGKLESSSSAKFFVSKDESLRLDSPNNFVEIGFVTSPPLVSFTWQKISTARGYLFELSDSAQFTKLIKSTKTESNAVSYDDLKEGRYFWKITALSSFPGSPDKKAGPHQFTIKKRDSYPAPVILRPSNGSEISMKEIENGQSILIWEGNPEFVKYKLEISKDSKFSLNLLSKEVVSNFFTPNWKSFGKGTFFARVKGYAKDGKEGEPSKNTKFAIVETKTIDEEAKVEDVKKLIDPKEELSKLIPLELISPVSSIVDMKGKDSLDFKWKGGPGVEKFEFILFQMSGQKRNAIFRGQTKAQNLSIRDLSILDEGNFSWEVVEHRNGNTVQSRKGNFIITLSQLKTLKSGDIEFISPARLYKEGKHR